MLQPAIRLAEEGFPVSPIIASNWSGSVEKLSRNAGATATFLIEGPEGTRGGRVVSEPPSSPRPFGRSPTGGPSVFYEGPLGRQVVDGPSRTSAAF